jgi:hypothetical protein
VTWSDADATALAASRDVLLSAVPGEDPAALLYARWYARPVGVVEAFGPWDPPLAGLLRAAHPAARSWSARSSAVIGAGIAGTAVVDVPGGRRAVCRGEYVTVVGSAGQAPGTGSRLQVLERRGGYAVDGWWRTWGPGWSDADTIRAGVTRIYLAPRVRDVAHLTNAVVTALQTVTDTWAFKVGVDTSTLARGDGAVAYVPDAVARSAMGNVLARSWGLVRTGRPPLTFELAPGIAWAEDPGDGDSFGEQRCRALAAAHPGSGPEEFLGSAAEAFVAAGLDPAKPWLRPRKVS